MLNTREIASVIWLVIFFTYVVTHVRVRESMYALARAFLNWKILLCILSMALYTSGCVGILAGAGYWRIDLLKDTLLWFVFASFAMVMEHTTTREDRNVFKETLVDNFKIAIVVEFLINTYTFPLLVELILVPFASFLVMMSAFAKSGKKYADVGCLVDVLLGVCGFLILGYTLYRASGDISNLETMDTVRNLLFVPILSVLFTPFVYAIVIVSTYEQAFVHLKIGPAKSAEVKSYARSQVIRRYDYACVRFATSFARRHVDSSTQIVRKMWIESSTIHP